jgi:hypothetical protein
LTTEQLPGALALIAKTNPQRAMEIQNQLQRTEQLYNASRQAEQQIHAQRTAASQQQLKAWTDQQDAIFEKEVASKHSPQQMQEIAQNVVGGVPKAWGDKGGALLGLEKSARYEVSSLSKNDGGSCQISDGPKRGCHEGCQARSSRSTPWNCTAAWQLQRRR